MPFRLTTAFLSDGCYGWPAAELIISWLDKQCSQWAVDVRSTCAHSSEKVYGLHSGGLREGAKGVSPCAESLHGLFRSFPTFFERGPVGLWPDLLSPHAACVMVFLMHQHTILFTEHLTVTLEIYSHPALIPAPECASFCLWPNAF